MVEDTRYNPLSAIFTMLALEGKTDREWRASTIRYILRNERYTGDTMLQKTYTTETLSYRRKNNKGDHLKRNIWGRSEAVSGTV